LHPALGLFGPDAAQTIFKEPAGLRITLSGQRASGEAVGVTPRFALSGDFEITASYEILEAAALPTGMGSGVKLWGQIGVAPPDAVTLAHVVRPDKSNVHVSILARGGRPSFKQQKSGATKGRLRLVRTGSELSFQVAEGDSHAFRELRRDQVRSDDLQPLRLSANTGGAVVPLSIRLIELTIRADRMPGRRYEPKGKGSWLVAGIAVVAVAAVAGVGGFFVWRRRRGT
jgi:hypothetical protein